jgi:repressor LexA
MSSQPTRERIYRFVRSQLLSGSPPSVREVRDAVGLRAAQSVYVHLEALVAEGRLIKPSTPSSGTKANARGYRLPSRAPRPFTAVPVLGRVQAGALSTAIEDIEDMIDVSTRNASDELFALRVRGESMRDAGILPGDIVIVRRCSRADSGDIVIALVDDEATVKRLNIRGRIIELRPENPSFAAIRVRTADLRILGKVIEVRRHLDRHGAE